MTALGILFIGACTIILLFGIFGLIECGYSTSDEIFLIKEQLNENRRKIMKCNVAKFEKVSYEQFYKDIKSLENDVANCSDDEIKELYDSIQLPTRATKNSAGYDIQTPFYILLDPGDTIKIPTGIRCKMDENYVMLIFVRSSTGIKKRCILLNGTGVIDSDYYGADNEGHIWLAIKNDGYLPVVYPQNGAICQAVFLPFGITEDDVSDGVRTGGIGSTSK